MRRYGRYRGYGNEFPMYVRHRKSDLGCTGSAIKYIILIAVLTVVLYYLMPYIMPYLMNLLPDLKNIKFPHFSVKFQ